MPKKVLLVDDDLDYLAQVSTQLKIHGFEVTTAENPTEAKEELAKDKPDIAIVDLMMENFDDGFALCHDIKKVDATIPVILVTGVASETGIGFDADTKEERSWIKADAILDKPILFEQLQREMSRLMKD